MRRLQKGRVYLTKKQRRQRSKENSDRIRARNKRANLKEIILEDPRSYFRPLEYLFKHLGAPRCVEVPAMNIRQKNRRVMAEMPVFAIPNGQVKSVHQLKFDDKILVSNHQGENDVFGARKFG